MEVDPTVTVPISKTVDLNMVEFSAACLEMIKECSERSPSKERSKTPIVHEQSEQPLLDGPRQVSTQDRDTDDRLQDESLAKSKSLDDGQQRDGSSRSSLREPDAANVALDQPTASPVSSSKTSNETTVSGNERLEKESSSSQDAINLESSQRDFKKLKEKSISLDSELSNEARDVPAKTFERRRSKIFETAEKFNQLASNVENEKPKKIFIPGVNVGGAKRVFERKASLSSITTPPPTKPTTSKMIIDVPPTADAKRNEKPSDKTKQNEEEVEEEDEKKKEEAKKRAVDIITGAIGKPPMQRRINGSPPISPLSQEPKKLPSKSSSGTNDSRSTTDSVTTPSETKFSFEEKSTSAKKEATVRNRTGDALPRQTNHHPRFHCFFRFPSHPRSWLTRTTNSRKNRKCPAKWKLL